MSCKILDNAVRGRGGNKKRRMLWAVSRNGMGGFLQQLPGALYVGGRCGLVADCQVQGETVVQDGARYEDVAGGVDMVENAAVVVVGAFVAEVDD